VDLPLFELSYRVALYGQLDVGVRGVDFRAWGMTHECHANFLQDLGFHQPSVEGVAEIMETDMADLRVLECSLPGAFNDPDWFALVGNHEAFGFAILQQQIVEPRS